MTVGKRKAELTAIADEAALTPLAHAGGGRNWEIPNVALGDSLISDVDRAVITVHHQLGRKFHLVGE